MARTQRKTIRSLNEQIAEMGDATLACRDLMHAWSVDRPYYRVEVEGGVRGGFYVERLKGCLRCDTKRVELYRVFRDRLELLRSHYVYPEGYLIHGLGNARDIRGRIRREQVRRIFDLNDDIQDTPQDAVQDTEE